MSRILIVDDEPAIRQFFHWALSDAGYAVASAANGEEALALPGHFDLLLTDVMMPRLTGDELARQMRLRDPSLKVLYVTAYSDHLFDMKVSLWEGEAYLDKPATAEALVEAVEELLTEVGVEPD